MIGERQMKKCGFISTTIRKVCKGKRNKHFGCKWEYIGIDNIDKFPNGMTETLKRHLELLIGEKHG